MKNQISTILLALAEAEEEAYNKLKQCLDVPETGTYTDEIIVSITKTQCIVALAKAESLRKQANRIEDEQQDQGM